MEEDNIFEQLNSRFSKEGNGSESPLRTQVGLTEDTACPVLSLASHSTTHRQTCSSSSRGHGPSFTGGGSERGKEGRMGKGKKSKMSSL